MFNTCIFVPHPCLAQTRFQGAKKKMAEIIAIIPKVYGYNVENGKMTSQEAAGFKWSPKPKDEKLAKHLCSCEFLTPMFQMKTNKDGILEPEGVVFFTSAAYKLETPVTDLKLLLQTTFCFYVLVLCTCNIPGC